MSRYLTVTELYARSGGADRVQRVAGSSRPTEALPRIEQALARAESEATSYLRGRYPEAELPATPPAASEALKGAIRDMTLFFLADAVNDRVGDEKWQRGYDTAVGWLRSVGRGLADLGLSAAPPTDQTRPQILTAKPESAMVFGNGALDDW